MTSTYTMPDLIETERLRLRPFCLSDVDAVFAYANDPVWAAYLPGIPQPYTRLHAEQFVAGQLLLDRSEHPTWAIELFGTAIGGVNARLHVERRAAAMGWSLARPHWGKGLVTEASRAVLQLLFEHPARLNRVFATADGRNIASLRVMDKLGMKREGVLRAHRAGRGELVNEVYCGVLRVEWEAKAAKPSKLTLAGVAAEGYRFPPGSFA